MFYSKPEQLKRSEPDVVASPTVYAPRVPRRIGLLNASSTCFREPYDSTCFLFSDTGLLSEDTSIGTGNMLVNFTKNFSSLDIVSISHKCRRKLLRKLVYSRPKIPGTVLAQFVLVLHCIASLCTQNCLQYIGVQAGKARKARLLLYLLLMAKRVIHTKDTLITVDVPGDHNNATCSDKQEPRHSLGKFLLTTRMKVCSLISSGYSWTEPPQTVQVVVSQARSGSGRGRGGRQGPGQ